jgi:hypothetical protein
MRETTQDPNLRLGIGEIPFGPLGGMPQLLRYHGQVQALSRYR